MEFFKYDLDNETETLAGMFRPAGSLFGYQGDNSPKNTNYREAIELLTEAFGPAIIYDDWRDVCESDAWPENLKRKIEVGTWYWNKSGTWSELYLTNDMQMNYLILAKKGTHINYGMAANRENTEA